MTGLSAAAEAVRLVMAAAGPIELFGTEEPARVYRRLAKLTHPDAGGDATAFRRLTALWRARDGVLVRGYRLGEPAYRGDLANLYAAGPGTFVKLARDPAVGDLMAREAGALRTIAEQGDPRYLPYVPRLVESFRHRDPATGAERRANVVAAAEGLRSLTEVKKAYPDGLDPRDAAWMWRRLLVALGLAHRAGVVHGAVLPDHVLIQPADHGVVLVDWCHAATAAEPIPAIVPRYADWYPPEVRARQAPGPGTDLAMAARCMADLMGERAPDALRAFANGCLLRDPRRRPDDAWALLAELDSLLERLYGPRTFRVFSM
jgi:hypothetical protein